MYNLGSLEEKIKKISEICVELKASAQVATQNKNVDNCAEKLHNISSKNSHKENYFA